MPGLALPDPGHRPRLPRGLWSQAWIPGCSGKVAAGGRGGGCSVPQCVGGRASCQLLRVLLPVSDPRPLPPAWDCPSGRRSRRARPGRGWAPSRPATRQRRPRDPRAAVPGGGQCPPGARGAPAWTARERKRVCFPSKTLRRKAGREGAGEGGLVLGPEAATSEAAAAAPLGPGARQRRQTDGRHGLRGPSAAGSGPECPGGSGPTRARGQAGGRRYLTRFSTEYTDMQ